MTNYSRDVAYKKRIYSAGVASMRLSRPFPLNYLHYKGPIEIIWNALVDGNSVISDSYAIALPRIKIFVLLSQYRLSVITWVICSFVAMQYLEDKYPEPPLLPQDLQKKALNHQVIVGSAIPFFMIATTYCWRWRWWTQITGLELNFLFH
jgi:hypothetical protein